MIGLYVDFKTSFGRCITQWSRQPGAVKYHTIIDRLVRNWDHERAVFEKVRPGRYFPRVNGNKPKHRRRRVRGEKRLFPVSLTQWGSVQSLTFGVAA